MNSDLHQRSDIILHIAKIDKLVTVMRNSYGNYVVQKALYLSNGDVKIALADAIYENIPVIQDKKIRVKWAQLLQNSIANDLNFVGRYNLEEYLQDSSAASASTPGLELLHHNSSNDSGIDLSLHCEKKRLSPSKMQMMNESLGYVPQPNSLEHGFSYGSNQASPLFVNFEEPEEYQDYKGYSHFNGMNPYYGNHYP